MSIENAGFESKAADPAPAGRADGWTAAYLSSVYDWAQYDVGIPVGFEGVGRERFDLGWIFNVTDPASPFATWPDDEQWEAALPEPALADWAVYDVETPTQEPFEDFEEAWEVPPPPPLGTMQGALVLVHAEAAVYDGRAWERFYWTPGPLDYDASHLESVDYDGVGGSEDFEQDWHNNPPFPDWSADWSVVVAGSGADAATYLEATWSRSYESFEAVADRFLVTDADLTGYGLTFDHSAAPLSPGDDVEFLTADGVPAQEDYSAELPKLPTPLRYGATYYVTGVPDNNHVAGLALGSGGDKIPLTAKGAGEFYLARARRAFWVSTM